MQTGPGVFQQLEFVVAPETPSHGAGQVGRVELDNRLGRRLLVARLSRGLKSAASLIPPFAENQLYWGMSGDDWRGE